MLDPNKISTKVFIFNPNISKTGYCDHCFSMVDQCQQCERAGNLSRNLNCENGYFKKGDRVACIRYGEAQRGVHVHAEEMEE